MGSVALPHLTTGWHVDQAILSEDERVVIIRFGRDWHPDCMRQDEVLYKIADRVKNFAVVCVTFVFLVSGNPASPEANYPCSPTDLSMRYRPGVRLQPDVRAL